MGSAFLQHTCDTAWSAVRLYFEPLFWVASRIRRRVLPSESRVPTHEGGSGAGARSPERPIALPEARSRGELAPVFATILSRAVLSTRAGRREIQFDIDAHEQVSLYPSELEREFTRAGLGHVSAGLLRHVGRKRCRTILTVVSESSPSVVTDALESYLKALTLEARLDRTKRPSAISPIIAALAAEPMGMSVLHRIRDRIVRDVHALGTILQSEFTWSPADQSALMAELERNIETLAVIDRTLANL